MRSPHLSRSFLALLALVVAGGLLTAACGADPKNAEGSTSATTSAGAAPAAAPAGGSAALLVKRKDIPEHSIPIVSAYAIDREGWYSVQIGDYEIDPDSPYIKVPPGKLAVHLNLKNADGSPLAAGQEFTMPANGPHSLNASINKFEETRESRMAAGITKGSQTTPVGSVKLLTVNDETITGEINLDSGEAGVKGTFEAKRHKFAK